MRLGYVGLGSMGTPLAERLSLAHDLAVHGRSADAVTRLVAAGARALPSARAVGAVADTVFICVRTSQEVRAAIFGAGGVAAGMAAGGTIVDQTTGDAHETRAMAAGLADRGITLIDAPVSGGPQGAAAGTIAQLVGADAETFARIRPVLEAISRNIVHCGPVGSGHVMKAANNLLAAGQRLLTFEALTLAVRNGVDPAVAAAAMRGGSGRNYTLEVTVPRHILSGPLAQGFTLGLMRKDVALALALGERSGMPMGLGEAIDREYREIAAMLGDAADVNEAVRAYECAAGVAISSDVAPA